MLGNRGGTIKAVGYLSTCGSKVVKVEGFFNDKLSFTQIYNIDVKNQFGTNCDSGSPTAPSPVRAPSRAPKSAPVPAPVTAPVPAPVSSCPAQVIGYTLVDAELDTDIMPLRSYTTSEVPDLLNIRADIRACSPKVVESVFIDLDGMTRCENFTPYAAFGDSSKQDLANDMARYNGKTISAGRHIIQATPYTQNNCQGTAGRTHTLEFTVANDDIPSPVRAPTRAPKSAPVTPPVTPPVTAPVAAPVAAPVTAPVNAPVSPPVTAPVKAPVAAPVNAPVTPPVTAPVTAPVTQPIPAPVVAPVSGSCPAQVTGYTLVDAESDTDIMPLRSYSMSEVPEWLNIRVDIRACNPKVVESVYIVFDGMSRCENFAPYAAFGDRDTKDVANNMAQYSGKAISVGRHIIEATPYTQNNCQGTAGRTHTMKFTVTGDDDGDDYY